MRSYTALALGWFDSARRPVRPNSGEGGMVRSERVGGLRAFGVLGAITLVLGGCEAVIVDRVNGQPSIPANGRYVTAQYTAGQVQVLTGLEYGQALNHQGNPVTLLLDLYLPPAGPDPERPTIVMVHGGGFCCGSRSALAARAREYARRGFVAASIDYRVRPNDTPEEQLAAALDAIDDGMESIRWLKSPRSGRSSGTTCSSPSSPADGRHHGWSQADFSGEIGLHRRNSKF